MIITYNKRDSLYHATYRIPARRKVLLAFSRCRKRARAECLDMMREEIAKGPLNDSLSLQG